MLKFNWEMPPRFTHTIYLRRNFVYISTLEIRGDTSIGQNFHNVVLNSHANFGEKLWKALTACHGPGGALGQVS